MRDLARGRFPDLRAGRLVVAQRAVRVAVLIGLEGAGDRLGQAVGHSVVRARVIGFHVGGGHHDLRSVGAQYGALGLVHFVGHHEDRTVAALLGHHGEPHAGVAGRRLYDHTAGLEFAFAFGGVDDACGDAVLGRSARVEVLHLDGDGGFDAVGHMVELDERGVADEFGKRVVDCHGSVPCVVGGRLVRTGVVRKTAPRESHVQTMALRWGAAARRYITVAFRQSGVGWKSGAPVATHAVHWCGRRWGPEESDRYHLKLCVEDRALWGVWLATTTT